MSQLANNNTGAQEQLEQIKNALNAGIRNFIIVPIDYKVINDAKVFDNIENLHVVSHDRMMQGLNPATPNVFNNGVKNVPKMNSSPTVYTKTNL